MSLLLLDGQRRTDLDWGVIGTSGFFSAYRVMTSIGVQFGQMIDFDRHLQRLCAHAELMRYKNIPHQDLLKFECEALAMELRSSPLAKLRVILFLDANAELHRIVTVESANLEDITSVRKVGIKLHLVTDKAWERGERIKTGVLGPRGVQLEEAKHLGFSDVLWCNADQEIAETTMANIFLMGRTGDLLEIATPPLSSGVLAGITRLRVMELLTAAKIPVTERIITAEEIPGFDEGFVTSSVRGIVPITHIGKHKLHTLRANAVFHHITRLYSTWLKSILHNDSKQLRKNDLL